jgi:hypothetical protein
VTKAEGGARFLDEPRYASLQQAISGAFSMQIPRSARLPVGSQRLTQANLDEMYGRAAQVVQDVLYRPGFQRRT